MRDEGSQQPQAVSTYGMRADRATRTPSPSIAMEANSGTAILKASITDQRVSYSRRGTTCGVCMACTFVLARRQRFCDYIIPSRFTTLDLFLDKPKACVSFHPLAILPQQAFQSRLWSRCFSRWNSERCRIIPQVPGNLVDVPLILKLTSHGSR